MVDLFFIILCLRICYIAVSRGILREIFKTLGVFFGSLLAFHYYPSLAKEINSKFPFLSKEVFYPVAFLTIFLIITAAVSLVRMVVLSFKKEEFFRTERLFSLLLGLLRSAYLFSVVIFLAQISPVKIKYTREGVSYRIFKNIAPKAYLVSFNLYHKFNPKIKLNEEVARYHETEKNLSGSSKKRH